jgi:hypothetical protein
MSSTVQTAAQSSRRGGGAGAAWTLVFLAPFIAEVLSGATRVSYIFVFIPEVLTWGCGALIIREVVRRWRGGWPSLLMLGMGLSIACELFIDQTSLAPLPWPGAQVDYGRVWGVNWIFFLFMLGFESVLVVLVPVRVTELIFSRRRDEPWLRTRGLVITSLIFLLGSFIAWYAWIKRARPMMLHVPEYRPAAITLAAAGVAIAVLAVEAYLMRGVGRTVASRHTPAAWVVGLVALALGFPWYALLRLQFSEKPPSVPFGMALAVGVAWAGIAYLLIRRWTSSPQWSDLHRWALAFAATLVCMVAGFDGSDTWLRMDLIGKIVLNAIALVGFLMLLRSLSRRGEGVAEQRI